jgi:hypothetical protein
MNVEIGAEAALFPEKEYINGIAVAVHVSSIGKVGNTLLSISTVVYCRLNMELL